MHVGDKTTEIWISYKNGTSIQDIAKQNGISESSVLKRIKSYERMRDGYYKPSNSGKKREAVPGQWTKEMIKAGFERFILEQGHLPSSGEVDEYEYLPSARNIQRYFGGLVQLREELGYEDVHLGRGEFRTAIAKRINKRGFDAEEHLENILIPQFGEVYVHAQKGYGANRTRFDFVVYALEHTFGIDVFASSSKVNIQKNINIKLQKYKQAPSQLEIYFVVYPEGNIEETMDLIIGNMLGLVGTNIQVMFIDDFLKHISVFQPLIIPPQFISFFDSEDIVDTDEN